ncbi:MAG: hypothetical protein JW997_04645 [Actinobacteria bacterium]|nr:hypothetical protein [Actinomycetota bacterium]
MSTGNREAKQIYEFIFEPAEIVSFKDREVLKKVRSVHGKELEKHVPSSIFQILDTQVYVSE